MESKRVSSIRLDVDGHSTTRGRRRSCLHSSSVNDNPESIHGRQPSAQAWHRSNFTIVPNRRRTPCRDIQWGANGFDTASVNQYGAPKQQPGIGSLGWTSQRHVRRRVTWAWWRWTKWAQCSRGNIITTTQGGANRFHPQAVQVGRPNVLSQWES